MKFCKHCGKELQSGVEFCKNCGKPVAKADSKVKESPKEKQQSLVAKFQSLPKAHKLTISIVSGVILLFIIFAFVVNYMTSSERLVKKFHAAVIEDNYDALGNLVVFDKTGEKIGNLHAEALADRIDEQDRLSDLVAHFENQNKELTSSKGAIVNLQKEGCFLFFDCYQITAKAYYVDASSNLNGAEVLLDGEKIAVIDHSKEDQKIGPFVYGSYDLEATFQNDFVEFHEKEPLDIYEDESSWRAFFDYESIYIDYHYNMDIERTFLLNGEEIDETMIIHSNDGEEVGPIDPEQSYTLEIKAAFPWGEMSTGEREVDGYFEQTFEINESAMDGVKQAVTTFYDDLFEAYNTNSVKPINYLDKGLIDDYAYDIERKHNDAEDLEDYIHFRDVKQFGIATEPVEIYYDKEDKSYKLSVHLLEESAVETQFYNTDVDPSYRNNYHTFHLSYKDDQWLVEDANFGNWPTDYEYTMFSYDGEPAEVLHGQAKKEAKKDDSKETEDSANQDAEEAIKKVTLEYIDGLVKAINAGDYSKVASTIQSGSSLEGMQQDLVKRLNEDKITQEVVDKEVTSVEKDGDVWKVKTSETIKIIYSNGDEETKDYNWTYTVVEEDGNYKLSNIE